jgi:hypothetical protein
MPRGRSFVAVESRIAIASDELTVHAEQNASLRELLKQLTEDASRLRRQEVVLGKIELKETVSDYAQDGARIAIALMLTLMGGLALTAFLIMALGHLLLGDNYWLSALIVAALFLAIGGLLVCAAMGDVRKHSLTPESTVATLKADTRWAQKEVQELKRAAKS